MVLQFQAAALGAAIALTAHIGVASAASLIDVDNLLIVGPYQSASGPAAASNVRFGVRQEDPVYQTWTVGTAGRLDRIDIVGMAWGRRALSEGAYYDDLNFTLTLGVYRGGVFLERLKSARSPRARLDSALVHRWPASISALTTSARSRGKSSRSRCSWRHAPTCLSAETRGAALTTLTARARQMAISAVARLSSLDRAIIRLATVRI